MACSFLAFSTSAIYDVGDIIDIAHSRIHNLSYWTQAKFIIHEVDIYWHRLIKRKKYIWINSRIQRQHNTEYTGYTLNIIYILFCSGNLRTEKITLASIQKSTYISLCSWALIQKVAEPKIYDIHIVMTSLQTHRFIDLVKSLGPELSAIPSMRFKVTARFVNLPPSNVYHAATFRSKHSYVGLAMLKAYSNVFIDFRFKTLEANGLLFYNGGRRSDFIAVELVNGHVHYVFDLGDGPITLRDKARIHMNDNRWHSVSIRRPGPKTHTLVVDDTIEVYTAPGNNMHIELDGILYVGGVFKDMYTKLPSTVVSRNGFEGCLGSVDFADGSPSLTEDAVVPSSLVVGGCEGPTKCSQNACANRGVCVQQWNAYACECDMTTYSGPTCYDGEYNIALVECAGTLNTKFKFRRICCLWIWRQKGHHPIHIPGWQTTRHRRRFNCIRIHYHKSRCCFIAHRELYHTGLYGTRNCTVTLISFSKQMPR